TELASDGKFLYSFGGRQTTASSTTVATGYRFDPTAAQPAWTAQGIAPMPTGVSAGKAVFLKGKIYIPGGGAATGQTVTSHFAYDVASNTWANVEATPSPALLYALAPDEAAGVYYFTGGSTVGQTGLTTTRSYDPAANAWTDLTPMTTARFGHEAALIEGKLYVAGGFGTTGTLSSGEVYDFSTKQWSPIAPLNRTRYLATSFVGKDTAGNPLWFIIGGQETAGGSLLGTEV